jgi:hypothetical protein
VALVVKLLADIVKGYMKTCHGNILPVVCRLSTPDGDYITMNGRIGDCIEKGLENHENLTQDSWCPGQDVD